MYEDQMNPAFAGMKADAGFDRVESYPVAADGLVYGVVVGRDANGKAVAGKGAAAMGISVHSHVPLEPLKQGDAVSVMTRGLIWARVADGKTVAGYEAVKFNAKGELDNTATDTLKNAVVRSVRTVDGKTLALVELHAPTA